MSSDTTLQTTEAGVDTDIRQRDIVVGVDGSDESFAALRWALQEASLTGQRVNAVYASWHRETSAGLGGAGQFRHGHQ